MKIPAGLNALRGVDLKAIKSKQAAFEHSFQNIPQTDPWVPLNLKYQEFKLEFSFLAAQNIQRELGKNLFSGEITGADLANMDTLMTMLVAGLQVHHEGTTIGDIAPLITLKHRMYYVHCIEKAMEVTQPDYDQLQEVLDDIRSMTDKLETLEAGDTTAPLPEIVPSPISGEPAA